MAEGSSSFLFEPNKTRTRSTIIRSMHVMIGGRYIIGTSNSGKFRGAPFKFLIQAAGAKSIAAGKDNSVAGSKNAGAVSRRRNADSQASKPDQRHHRPVLETGKPSTRYPLLPQQSK